MRLTTTLIAAAAVTLVVSAVAAPPQKTQPTPAAVQPPPPKPPLAKVAASGNTPAMRYVASVRDLMHVMVEPAADIIFDAVTVDVTEKGTVENRPRTDEDWDELEHGAMALAESVNLLKMPNRPIARPDEMHVDPEGPELPPAEIARRVARSRAQWNRLADSLQDVTLQILTLIEKKDADGIFQIGGALDQTCEDCHQVFWYPEEKRR